MNTSLLPAEKDPMGAAIADFYHRQKADRLRVFSSQFDEDEIPIKQLSAKPDKCLYSNAQPSQWLPEQYST